MCREPDRRHLRQYSATLSQTLWGGSLISALLPTNLLRKDQAEVNCVVARFKIQDGIARSDAILIDTTDVTIRGHRAIDLCTEELKFVFQPAPRRATLVSLGTPVTVTGTLAHPIIGAKSDATLLSLGKLAVGFLNPVYLVVLTTDTGTGVANPCVEAVARRDAGEAVSKPRGLLGRLGGLFKKPPKTFE